MPNSTIKVIEINPFVCHYMFGSYPQHFSTGAPFFHWKKGSEGRKRLVSGPFEFRTREEPPPQSLRDSYMATPYQKEIDALLEEESSYPPLFLIAAVVIGAFVAWQVRNRWK
jgi:hypothetical protein